MNTFFRDFRTINILINITVKWPGLITVKYNFFLQAQCKLMRQNRFNYVINIAFSISDEFKWLAVTERPDTIEGSLFLNVF